MKIGRETEKRETQGLGDVNTVRRIEQPLVRRICCERESDNIAQVAA